VYGCVVDPVLSRRGLLGSYSVEKIHSRQRRVQRLSSMPADANQGGAKKAAPRNTRLVEAQRRAKKLSNSSKAPRTFPEMVDGLRQTLVDHWSELKKTTWPTPEVLRKSTYVVLAFVGAVAVWVGGLDYLLSQAEKVITR
jgi:preprotein translocase SecE subunit